MNGGTCIAEAVRVAGQLLKSLVAPEGARSIVLLTDGRVDHYQGGSAAADTAPGPGAGNEDDTDLSCLGHSSRAQGECQRQGSFWPQTCCCCANTQRD